MYKKNTISRDGDLFRVKINVLLYEEDKCYVAYCPALELSSYGDTKQDAKISFNKTMEIFIEETVKKGTLEKVLLQLGWTLRKFPEANYIPPEIPDELINKYNSNTITEQIAFPI